MAERQIGHRKSCLVLSARFPVVNWRSRPVAKSAYSYYVYLPFWELLEWQSRWSFPQTNFRDSDNKHNDYLTIVDKYKVQLILGLTAWEKLETF